MSHTNLIYNEEGVSGTDDGDIFAVPADPYRQTGVSTTALVSIDGEAELVIESRLGVDSPFYPISEGIEATGPVVVELGPQVRVRVVSADDADIAVELDALVRPI